MDRYRAYILKLIGRFSSVLLDQDVGGALDFWPLLKSNTSRPHQYSLLINVKVFGHFHEKMVATSTEKI